MLFNAAADLARVNKPGAKRIVFGYGQNANHPTVLDSETLSLSTNTTDHSRQVLFATANETNTTTTFA